ncbi:MAG: O-antigen ligase family protein [Ferruginibacter sp.]
MKFRGIKINASSAIYFHVILANSLIYLKVFTAQNYFVLEFFLCIILFVLSMIHFIKENVISFLKYSEAVYFLFIYYVIIKSLLTNNFDALSISYLILSLVFYYGIKCFILKRDYSAISKLIFWTSGITLIIYLGLAAFHCFIKMENLNNFFYPNVSIFSIVLASQISFILPICVNFINKETRTKYSFTFIIILILLSVILLALTNGRAGWIGFILALVYIAYQYQPILRIKKVIIFLALSLIILLGFLLSSYKSDSSGGRILIYKISGEILKENWLWGIGHGQFKVQYNLYQAKYFAFHNIDSKEAMLADNSYYAFNDYFQVFIENGVIGFLILGAILFFLYIQFKNTKTNNDNKHLFIASIASLICIVTGSFFSYPLHVFPLMVQAILCVALLNSFPTSYKFQVCLPEKLIIFSKVILVLISVLLLIHYSFYVNYKIKSDHAFKLKRIGYKHKSLKIYQELNKSYIREGNALYLYAQQLYYSNQLLPAKMVLKDAKNIYSSNEVYKLSASIENELYNFEQAEKDYKTAIYMVPNRMAGRNNLLDFYLERKDTTQAIYWANSIVNMPVKIPSQRTKNMKQKANEILKAFNF